MAGGSLGTVYGTVRMDVSAALASYALLARAGQTATASMLTGSAAVAATGKTFIASGLAIAAGVGYAINAAADFEKKLDFFGAVSNSTAEQMEAVRAKALELGEDTAYSASQIADAFIDLGKAGIGAEDIINGMAEAVVALGAAADIPLSRAADIMTAAIQTFELGGGDAMHVADLLAGAANASIIDVEDLGVSLKYVGGVANAISIPIEDVVDAISLLGKAGIKGSTAGTSLRQILVSLSGTSKKASNKLKELGIITEDGKNKFFDAEGKAKPLADIFQILGDATKNLSEEQRLSAFKIIFNNRALAAAAILSREGAAGFAEMNDEISKTTAADVAAKRLDNLAGDVKKLKGALQTMFIQAGGPFQEFLRGIVQYLTTLVKAFNDLDPSTQALIFKILAVVGSFLIFVGVTLRIIGLIFRFGAMLGRAWPLVVLLSKVVVILTRGLWALGVALLTTPIGWLILGIIALIAIFAILWNKSETFRDFWKDLGRTLVDVGKEIIDWFKGLPKFFTDLWKDITGAFTTGVDGIKKAWSVFTGILTDGWNATIEGLLTGGKAVKDFFVDLPGNILEGLKTAFQAILDFLKDLPYNIGFAIGFVLGTIIRWGAELATLMFNIGLDVTEAVLNFFIDLPGNIWDALVWAYENVVKWGTDTKDFMVDVGPKIFHAIVDWFKELPGNIWQFLKDAGEKIVWETAVFIANATELGENAVGAILKFFKDLPQNIWDFLMAAGKSILGFILSFAIWGATLGKSAFDAIVNGVKALPEKIWDILQEVIQQFKNVISAAFDAAKDFAKGLWDGFKKGLGINSPSYIEKAMFQMNDTFAAEMKTMRSNVRGIQRLGKTVDSLNPALTLSTATSEQFRSGLNAMQSQLAQVQAMNASIQANRAAANIGFDGASADNLTTFGRGPDDPGSAMVVNMNVFNPLAEPASSTAARKLRTLSEMGALK